MHRRNRIFVKTGCAATVGWMLLGLAGAASAQQTRLEQSQESLDGTEQVEGSQQVVFSVDQMPRAATRSVDDLRAARLEPPGTGMRAYLVRYQGLESAEVLRAMDRALRARYAGELEEPAPR